MKPIIEVRGISKRYKLGQIQGYKTIRESFSQLFSPKKSSPLAGEARWGGSSDHIWALKDVSFDVQPGEVIGIIGRNGSGKSTLLKILTRITEPTEGTARIRGQVASLLEVGTGFHPELTGRENVYLNGAILGMRKTDIDKKFDEIIAFAEVERFVDTPVKRYSSGMYVRLAFAVAAHLEPEILLVDEVLAVGDFEFQKKCLGKMKHVSTMEGRTVLFVSHNTGMIAQLCKTVVLLKNGENIKQGNAEQVIDFYLKSDFAQTDTSFAPDDSKEITILKIRPINAAGEPADNFSHQDNILLNIVCQVNQWIQHAMIAVVVKDKLARPVFTTQVALDEYRTDAARLSFLLKIPGNFLVPGSYSFDVCIHIINREIVDYIQSACRINIIDTGSDFSIFQSLDYGCVFANCQWEVNL